MSQSHTQLQDDFLEHLRDKEISVTLFLINGVKLQGLITAIDENCVMLRRDGHVQLVYKHALSTVMPQTPMTEFEVSSKKKS